MQTIVPDVVLTDQYSATGLVVATELKLPVVVNIPQNLAQLELDGYDVVNMTQATSCCGMICIKRSFENFMLTVFGGSMRYYGRIVEDQHTNIWMLNSFWGIDKPTVLPPNIQMIGPLAKFDAPYM